MATAERSSVDPSITPLVPTYPLSSAPAEEPPHLQSLINHLSLTKHIEGGYFVETDRSTQLVPNPFLPQAEVQTFTSSSGSVSHTAAPTHDGPQPTTIDPMATGPSGAGKIENTHRTASTSIHYLLTPSVSLGHFHRNKGRTIHTLHKGRGRYVIIHADEVMEHYDSHSNLARVKARVETFVVGRDVAKGERLQWIVEGGKYKASYLLAGEEEGEGLLISETVVPGFEYADHDFLTGERFEALVTAEQAKELEWLVRKE